VLTALAAGELAKPPEDMAKDNKPYKDSNSDKHRYMSRQKRDQKQERQQDAREHIDWMVCLGKRAGEARDGDMVGR
jgi:hypothetical protein